MANSSLPQIRHYEFSSKKSCIYAKCFRCRQQIRDDEFVLSTEQAFHVKCFKCALCGKQLIPGEHTIYDRYTYCKLDCIPISEKEQAGDHTEQFEPSVFEGHPSSKNCVKCDLPVRGTDYVMSKNKVWHRICFRCTLCKRYLTPSDHMMKKTNSYCRYPCFQRKFLQ